MAEESSVTFERDCVERITAGDALSDAERRRFAALLEERERSGLPLLGRFAGTDGSLDTVSGRCGVRPPFADIGSEEPRRPAHALCGNFRGRVVV